MSDFSSLIGQYIQYQIVSFDYDYDEGVLDAEVEISNCVDQIAEIINCNNKIIIKSIVDIIKIDNFWMFENNKLISCDRKGNKVEKKFEKKNVQLHSEPPLLVFHKKYFTYEEFNKIKYLYK